MHNAGIPSSHPEFAPLAFLEYPVQTLSESSKCSTGLIVLRSQSLAHEPARCHMSLHNRIEFEEVDIRKLSIAKLWTAQKTYRLPCSQYFYCRRHCGSFTVVGDQEVTTV